MSRNWFVSSSLLVLATALLASAACTPAEQAPWPADPAQATAPADSDELATVVLALTTVPADVKCVKVIVEANRTVTRTFDVTTGAAATLTVDALPVGPATLDEQTFNTACTSVTSSTKPTWVAQRPVPLTLVPGQ